MAHLGFHCMNSIKNNLSLKNLKYASKDRKEKEMRTIEFLVRTR